MNQLGSPIDKRIQTFLGGTNPATPEFESSYPANHLYLRANKGPVEAVNGARIRVEVQSLGNEESTLAFFTSNSTKAPVRDPSQPETEEEDSFLNSFVDEEEDFTLSPGGTYKDSFVIDPDVRWIKVTNTGGSVRINFTSGLELSII